MNGPFAIPRMAERDRRVLAAGAACILLMILGIRVIPAVRRWEIRVALREALLMRQLAESRRVVGHEQEVADTLRFRAHLLTALEAGLIRAQSKSAGEAALAALVSTTAQSAGIKLDALALDAAADRGGGIGIVSVTGGATGDIEGVAAFVAALERVPARVATRSIAISDADPAAPETRAELLRLEFTVEAQVVSAGRRNP